MFTRLIHSVFFFFILFTTSVSNGQNLISDPSFEVYTPGGWSSFDYLGELDLWWTVSGSPDYHHTAHPPGSNLTSLENCALGNGDSQCGVPFHGEAVLGMVTGNSYYEWAATTLIEPLEVGECYVVSMWMQNKTDDSVYYAETSNWGVFFSSTGLPVFDPVTVDFNLLSTQYVMMDEMLLNNDWTYVDWIFTADFAYEYIYIGFMDEVSTATQNLYGPSAGAYAWIDMVTVMNIDSVEIEAIADLESCPDSTVYLSAESNVYYHWSWDDGTSIQTSSDSILVDNPSVTTTYYAYAGDLDNCAKVDSVTVTMLDCTCLIPIETTVTIFDNTNCPLSEAGNGMVVVDPSNGIEPYTYLWDDPMTQTNDTASALSGGYYACYIYDADNCGDTIYAFVDETAIPILSFDVTLESCVGSMDAAIDLTVQAGNPPYVYQWSNDSTTQDLSNISVGWYAVTVTDGINCPFTDSVYVDYAPAIEYIYPLICEGSDIANLNTVGATDGTWNGTGIVDPILGLFDPVVAGVGVFTIEFLHNTDCAQNFTMQVTVDALPNVNFTANVQSGCQPLDVFFSVANAGPDATYIWNFGDGNISSQPQDVQYTYNNWGTFDVSLAIIDSSGCSDDITYIEYMNVYERPIADFNFTPEVLDDVQSMAQFFSTSSEITNDWFWSFGDGAVSYSENPTHNYSAPGYYPVSLTATSAIGCADVASNYVRYKDVIFMYIPNAFTPNADGRNDVFQVRARGEINIFSLKIFDRWGELVFETSDINQPWVGNKLNGEYYLTTGVFSYVLEYEAWGAALDEPIGEKFTGTIMLMK